MDTCFSHARLATGRPIRFAVAAALAAGSLAAHAVPIGWVGGAGNWFDTTQWNPAQVPSSVDSASVNNGGTATAATAIAANSLSIGTSSGASGPGSGTVVVSNGDVSATPFVGRTTFGGANATGSLTITNGNLLPPTGSSGLNVGVNFQSDGAAANGTIAIANGSISFASAVPNPDLQIGLAIGGAAKSGSATGVVSALTIDTSANALGFALIGRASNGGSANGTLSLLAPGGTLRVAKSFQVGALDAQGGGSAIGVANLAGAQVDKVDSTFHAFEVGSVNASGLINNLGLGTANGQATIAGSAGYETYRVGTIIGTVVNDSVRADGVLNVGSGGLVASATNPGSLQIGASQGTLNNNQLIGRGGIATGAVTVSGGDVSNFASIQVGRAEGFGSGIGRLEVTGSNMVMSGSAGFQVGTARNINGAITDLVPPAAKGKGEVVVRNSLLTFQPASPFPSSLVVGEAINSGSSANPSNVAVDADGKLTLDNVTLTGNPGVRVGSVLSGFATAPTTAKGELNTIGGSMAVSSLTVGAGAGADGRLDVSGTQVNIAEGFVVGSGSGAQGQATIANAAVTVGTSLGVGASNAPLSAPMSGQLSLLQGSVLTVAGNAIVGPANQGGAGSIELVDSRMRVDGLMRVGQNSNAGALFGDGSVRVERSLVDVGGNLLLDIGSTLIFAIDGLTRVSEYGAFDVGTAALDGLLNIDLGLLPMLSSMHFDLIVSSLRDGISGDFDAVNLQGLAAGYVASYGVVIDQGVEIYRLSLTSQVPEPATLALLLLALGMLSMRSRRSLRPLSAR